MADMHRKRGVSSATFYRWQATHGGMEIRHTLPRLKQTLKAPQKLKPRDAAQMMIISYRSAVLDQAGVGSLGCRDDFHRLLKNELLFVHSVGNAGYYNGFY